MGTSRSNKVKSSFTLKEAALSVKLKQSELREFAKEGIFEFANSKKETLDRKNFDRLRVAASLKKELEVNAAGIDVILHLLDKISEMSTDFNAVLKGVKGNLQSKVSENISEIKKRK